MHFGVTNYSMTQLIGSGKAYLLWQSMSNEISNPLILLCPEDKEHSRATNFDVGLSDANISYFFNLDVSDDSDPQLILAGDDNLAANGKSVHNGILSLSTNDSVAWTDERHHSHKGNILLADGSVQITTSAFLQQLLHQTGTTTNRLVIP